MWSFLDGPAERRRRRPVFTASLIRAAFGRGTFCCLFPRDSISICCFNQNMIEITEGRCYNYTRIIVSWVNILCLGFPLDAKENKMISTVSAVLAAAAILLALILNMALRPARAAVLSRWLMVIALLGGLVYYGAGYREVSGDWAVTVVRLPVFVLRMFVGINELAAIAGSKVVSSPPGLLGFWLVHLFAFFSVASAVMNTLGAALMRQLRLFLSRRGALTLIYGLNENAVSLGKQCLAAGGNSVVFIADQAPDAKIAELNSAGMSVLTGAAAAAAEPSCIRKLHLKDRTLSVYALDEAEDRDLAFALKLRDTLEQEGIPAEKTRVTLPGAEDVIAPMLQETQDRYGYGFVNVFTPSMLAARALIRMVPPWDLISFGPDGRAREDFECVIAGFGSHGQAALKQLIMNGQFAGSTFRAAIFSPKLRKESGYLETDCPELFRQYEISRFEGDARGTVFYRYIERRLSALKLIVVATGDAESDREISDDLMLFLRRHRAENICVVRCGKTGVRFQERIGSPIRSSSIYSLACLSAEDADRGAIVLNACYDTGDRSDWEKWLSCNSFGRMSSRASADFAHAFLRAAGCRREEVLSGAWPPSEELLQTLGETEHLRWMAFHFVMGYRPMSEERLAANERLWLRCREEGLPCRIRLTKDTEERLHACLIPWDELDALSRRETALTGRAVNYKQLDINNVLTLPRLLRSEGGDCQL